MADFPFRDGDSILFQGDSITDAGRSADRHAVGNGYVAIIKGFLAARRPDLRLDIINRGVSGDAATDLAARWERDVMDLKPTHLSVMVGVNDVWRFFHACDSQPVELDQYKTLYRQLLEAALEAGTTRLVLMTPTCVGSDPQEESNVLCAEYAAAVEDLARQFDAVLVPSRDVLWKAVAAGPSVDFWLPDGVHPSAAGHAVLAEAWLTAVGVLEPPS